MDDPHTGHILYQMMMIVSCESGLCLSLRIEERKVKNFTFSRFLKIQIWFTFLMGSSHIYVWINDPLDHPSQLSHHRDNCILIPHIKIYPHNILIQEQMKVDQEGVFGWVWPRCSIQ